MSNVSVRFTRREGYPGVISINYLDGNTGCLVIDLWIVAPMTQVSKMIESWRVAV